VTCLISTPAQYLSTMQGDVLFTAFCVTALEFAQLEAVNN